MKKKGKKIGLIVLLVVLVLFAAVCIGGYLFVHNFYTDSNYTPDEDAMKDFTVVNPEEIDQMIEQMDPEEEGETEESISKEEEEEIESDNAEFIEAEPVKEENHVYNVLLIGVDRRDRTWAGNSDAMILMSLNEDKKQISMVSLMRDSYVNIPGIGMRKLNAAHANGAGPLLLKTITQNYKIQVDRYVSVDFFSLADIIDALGGLDLELTAAEAEYMNAGLTNKVLKAGTNHCDGEQTVSYARIRYVGNSDYQRTERQRTVLTKIMDKLKTMSVTKLYDFVKQVLPLVTHNIPEDEIWSMLAKAPTLFQYNLVKERVPYDGMFRPATINKRSVLVLDWEKNVSRLKQTLY